jgi:hypothetical protein
VKAAGRTVHGHRLAVIPATPTRSGSPAHVAAPQSYLIVAEAGTPTLRFLALPSRQLVHTHTVHGAEVRSLEDLQRVDVRYMPE